MVSRGAKWSRLLVAGAALTGVGCGSAAAPPPPTTDARNPQLSVASATGAVAGWVQVPAANPPLPRNSAGFAYDEQSGRMLVSGGRHGCDNSATNYIDTWTLNGSTWQQQHPKVDGPGTMSSFVMADDPASRQVVALGVFSGCGVETGMFTWTGADWTQSDKSLALPDPSFSYTLTYDELTHQLLAVGSTHPMNATTPKEVEETWAWDGRGWTRLQPAHSPPPLADAAAAYDPASRRVILFGGAAVHDNGAADAVVADTWAWDGTDWTHLQPATHPSAREGAAMATDAVQGRAMLFGGTDGSPGASGATVFGDTWAWATNIWVQLHPAAAPSPRFLARMAYDPSRQQVVLFGGALNGSTDSDEVWVYRNR